MGHVDAFVRAPCRHCGLPCAAGDVFCCHGCEAVAGAIQGLGLEEYYHLRTAPAPSPAVSRHAVDDGAFDDPGIQARFARPAGQGLMEAELLVEGMRCAACAWLVEHALARTPGVAEARVNYSSRRAVVRWRVAELGVSALLGAIRGVGYAAWPYEEGRIALVEERERRTLLRRLWVAGLAMMQVMMYAFPAYVADSGEITPDVESLMRWASLILTLPVMTYSAAPFLRGAWRDVRLLRPGMDVPVALGLCVAFAASAWATVAASGPVYFDSITMFVFLLLGGRYLELLARARAGLALLHLARLAPHTAQRLRGDSRNDTEAVPAARLVPGDRVLVRAGDHVPADGELESGEALVSEAWVSGESRPLAKRAGDALTGGSVNLGEACVLRVRRAGADTALAAIRRMMERALDERPRWIEAAQRASGIFVVAVLACAAAAALAWYPVDPERAVWIAVSVLVVTCPCALALATPAALTVAGGALARRNLVVARGGAIERLAAATACVFDKTGTLTQGRPRLVDLRPLGSEPPALCRELAAALARGSSHPLDRALAATAEPGLLPGVRDLRTHPGEGVEGRIGTRRLRMGSARFAGALHRRPVPPVMLDGALTAVWLADEAGWIAVFGLGDALRPEASAAVARLRSLGLEPHLVSGDREVVVRAVARELGIAHFESDASPQRKRERVRELQAGGARVAMVGDGINDAPALAQSDVSVAMGGGADLAQLRADAVLLSDSLADFADAVSIARRTRNVIRQNLAWALAYNALVIPLAFAGKVTPVVAGVAMAASSLLVVANALRLRR